MSGTSECRIPAKRKERMMAELSTSIQVNADLSSIIKNMSNAVSLCAGSFGSLEDAADHVVDTGQFLMAGAALDRMEYEAQSYKENIVAATMQQEEMNQSIQAGEEKTNGLLDKIEGIASSYLKLDTLKKVFNIADNLAQTTAGLNAIAGSEAEVLALQDQIYDSAQRSRTSYLDMADTVTKLSLESGGVFANNQEAIVFAENLNKSFAIAGASQQEISSATAQVTKALGAGVLRSEELNTLFGSAPGMIQHMADYLGVNTQQLREMAAQGELTADVVKNAMLSATDEIDEQLAATPMTWAQAGTNIGNMATKAFQPLFDTITAVTQSEAFQTVIEAIAAGFSLLAEVAGPVLEGLITGAAFLIDNWNVIAPILLGVCAAVALYEIVTKGATLATQGIALATKAWGVVQSVLNAVMALNPVMWVILGVIALIAIIYAVVAAINNVTGAGISATGLIAGAFAVAGAAVWNVILGVVNSIIGIGIELWNLIAVFVNYFGNVFNDPVGAIAHLFAGLFDFILGIVQSVAAAIDTVLGTNMAGAVEGFRKDFAAGIDDIFGEQTVIMEKVNASEFYLKGIDYGDAWDAGYQFGEGIDAKAGSLFDGGLESLLGYNSMVGIDEQVTSTAENTGRMADSMELSEEDMKYIRDIAEREVIDRTVFSSISVDMGGVTNTVSNMADLDNIPQYLVNTIQRQMEVSAEGVHTDV